jgi:PAS domain S-box-containing protein
VDLDRNVTIWNPASEDIFGWTAEEVVGRPMPMAMTPPEERMPRRWPASSGRSRAK